MSTEENVNTESDLEQLRPLLAKQHDDYREMLQEPIDNSISSVSYKTPHALVVLSTISRRNAIKTPCTRCTVFRDS